MGIFPTQRRQHITVSIRDAKNDREAAAVRRAVAQLMVVATVLMVLFCGMFPFDFTLHVVQWFDWSLGQLRTAGDGPENIIFFMPFGFTMAALLVKGPRQAGTPWPIAQGIITLFAGFTLSFIVEYSQKHLASRDPSLSDLTCNTIGGVLGFVAFLCCGEFIMRPILRAAQAVRHVRDTRLLVIPAILWTILFLLLPVSVRDVGSLSTWRAADPLLVGNETNNERGWKGTVANLWIGARAFSDDELERTLAGKDPQPMLGDNAMAAYHFSGMGPYQDATGNCGPLEWTADHATGPGEGPDDRTGVMAIGRVGMPISWAWWLRSADGAVAKASDRIARSDSFSIVTDCATSDMNQTDRDPRIISISQNSMACNVQLIQNLDRLIVRIRSFGTGPGGADPSFAVPNIFDDLNNRRIVINYNHGKLLVASDRSSIRHGVQLSPESFLVWRIYPRSGWRFRMDSHGQSLCGLMYRALAMLPLGLLLGTIASVLRKSQGHLRLPRQIIFAGVVVAAVSLEGVLLGICGSPVHALGPVVSISAGLIGALATGRKSLFSWMPSPSDS